MLKELLEDESQGHYFIYLLVHFCNILLCVIWRLFYSSIVKNIEGYSAQNKTSKAIFTCDLGGCFALWANC